MKVTNKTRLNMVIGYPLEHSQSPVLHEAAYQLLGVDAVLLAQPHSKIKPLIQAIKTLSVKLTAVTSPFKEKIIKYLDQCSPEVAVLQAANTLIQCDGKLHGYNTDIDGIAFALHGISVINKRVVVIGAGGAAKAMGYFLKENQADIYWINRTQKNAVALANKFGGNVIRHDELSAMHIDILINTTLIGLYPHVDNSPLPDYIFNPNQVVFDMVYNPMITRLLKQAKSHQAKIISGLDMFIGQALKQIELLTDIRHTPVMIDQIRKILIQNQRVTCT